jgi:hypothetical protein
MDLSDSFPNLWAALTALAGTRRDAGVGDPAIEPGHLQDHVWLGATFHDPGVGPPVRFGFEFSFGIERHEPAKVLEDVEVTLDERLAWAREVAAAGDPEG